MSAFLFTVVSSVIPFVVMISLIVTVHELGHFLTAKACGVAIERFSIGFGRALISWRDRSGVEWRIGWLPLGGYVRFAGDENIASVPDQEDLEVMRARDRGREGAGAELKYLPFKPLWQRALIIVAGPAANFLLAILLFALIFATFGEPVTPARSAGVQPGSAAAQRAGFQAGDHILSADGRAIADFEDLTDYVALPRRRAHRLRRPARRPHDRPRRHASAWSGDQSAFGGTQGSRRPRHHGQGGESACGWTRSAPWSSGGGETWDVLRDDRLSISGAWSPAMSAPASCTASSAWPTPPGAITKQAIADAPHDPGDQILGVVVNLISFAALISVSIGFMNLLPLPVLDGGHLLFYAYEWIARRPLGVRLQAAGYRVGLALLVCLMLFANLHDLPLARVFHFFGSLFS